MRAFSPYTDGLHRLLKEALTDRYAPGVAARLDAALDGEAGRELRSLVDLKARRLSGAFFTGSEMAERALGPILPTISGRSVVVDPACGAGDLLVAVAKHLPVLPGVHETLEAWNPIFRGRDLHPEFVAACRRRLALVALGRNEDMHHPRLDFRRVFTNIQTGCGLTGNLCLGDATHIVINPPFTKTEVRRSVPWATGRISNAALFVDACIAKSSPGTRIVAILPDVLRSGTQARRWRKSVEARSSIVRIERLGQFSEWADIDVFVLELVVSSDEAINHAYWDSPSRESARTVGDYFRVSVGRVVPFRDPDEGKPYRYIHPRTLEAWGVDSNAREYRGYTGVVTPTPFVAVRRTSRQGHKHRAVATVVVGDGPVAVENHLIVLCPIDGTRASCEALLCVLRSPRSDEWIDRKIRCRHITASTLEHLPWWPEVK